MDFVSKFLPNQWENKRLNKSGKGDDPFDTTWADEEMFNFTCMFNGFADYSDLKLEVPESMPVEEMASNPVTIALLQFIVKIYQPMDILEIGTFIGISAIKMAQACQHSFIVSIEKGEEFYKIATQNIINNGMANQIGLYHEDALPMCKALSPASKELVFLDADKEHYDEYIEPLGKLLRPGGVLVVDDCFFHGDVLNEEPSTEKGKGVKRMLDKVREMSWTKVLLPLANGILIMQKP